MRESRKGYQTLVPVSNLPSPRQANRKLSSLYCPKFVLLALIPFILFAPSPGIGALLLAEVPQAVLLSHGSASVTTRVLYSGGRRVDYFEVRRVADDRDAEVWAAEDASVFVHEITAMERLSSQFHANYSIMFELERAVGVARWAFVVGFSDGAEEEVRGEFVVAGLVVHGTNGAIIGGGGGGELDIGGYRDVLQSSGKIQFRVDAIGVDGRGADVTVTGSSEVHVHDESGIDMRVVDHIGFSRISEAGNTGVGGIQVLELRLAPYRVGSGRLVAVITVNAIENEGEVFETVLHILIDTLLDPPPPVVIADSMHWVDETDGGQKANIAMLMFNAYNAKVCTIAVDGVMFDADGGKSRRILPDQVFVFPIGHASDGKSVARRAASISCDGIRAVSVGADPLFLPPRPSHVVGGTATDMEADPSPLLGGGMGESIEAPLQHRDMLDILCMEVSVTGVPNEYVTRTVTQALRRVYSSHHVVNDVIDSICHYIEGTNCSLTGMRVDNNNSSLLVIEGYVRHDKRQAAGQRLEDAIATCAFQKRISLPCDAVHLNIHSVTVELGPKGGQPSRGRVVPIWAISVLTPAALAAAAVALLVSIVAVQRRLADAKERDMSRYGPIGVPSQDDIILYQHAIVRDIYGRGENSATGTALEAAFRSRDETDFRGIPVQRPNSSGRYTANTARGAFCTFST
jgi:hypothetical protein